MGTTLAVLSLFAPLRLSLSSDVGGLEGPSVAFFFFFFFWERRKACASRRRRRREEEEEGSRSCGTSSTYGGGPAHRVR